MPEQSSAIDGRLLTETLDTIAAERGNFDRAFDLVDDVVRKFGETGLAERLYSAIPRERPWQDVADLFGILIWSTSDNGGALTDATERWLRDATDVRQIQIALNLDVYPFLEQEKMEQVLNDVATKFPEVSDRCRELVESRRKLGHNQTPQRTGAAGTILRVWKQLKRRLGRRTSVRYRILEAHLR